MTNVIQLKDKLQFEGTALEIYSINDTPWMQSRDLAIALGYKDETSVRKLFDRNKDEFTSNMSQTVKLTASGNYKKTVRLFSPRGCHLIAIMAKTKMAKSFRKWVLDVLETYKQDVKPQQEITPPTFYAKTMLADGTDSEVATRNQAKHLIGKMNKMMEMMDHMEGHVCIMNSRLEEVEAKVRGLDSKIRVFAVDSDSLAKLDLVMGNTLEVVMRGKSYKDRIIKCLKEENAKLRQTVQVMTHNTAWATA